MSNTWLRSERGMVGKAAVIWLFLVAVVAVGALDAVSIARTTLRLSEIAVEAARQGETIYRTQGHNVVDACAAAEAVVTSHGGGLKLGKNGCEIDAATGRITVTLRTTADTILAGRFEPTRAYAQVVVTEANGRASL